MALLLFITLEFSSSYSGLMCVIRIELGVLSGGRLGAVEIVSEYIQNGKYSEVPFA